MEKKCKIIYLNNFIYILSDDEIEETDWFILLMDNGLHELHNRKTTNIKHWDNNYAWTKDCKKIIATTDISLNYETPFYGMDADNNFPQPSQQFIEKYIESYNCGKIITEVLVEYNCGDKDCTLFGCKNHLGCNHENIQTVVIKQDNTINIKPAKDIWNREELIQILEKFDKDSPDFGYGEDKRNKWIEKNL